MVAPLSPSLLSPTITAGARAGGSSAGGVQEASKEVAALKAEILSARSEKQCTTCPGDQKKLDEQIKRLETEMRQVQSRARPEPPREIDRLSPADRRIDADAAPGPSSAAVGSDPAGDRRSSVPPGQPGHLLDITV